MASNAAGDTVIAWLVASPDVDRTHVKAIYRPADGRWTQPRVISPGRRTVYSGGIDAAVDTAGNASVVYGMGNGRSVHLAVRRAGDGWQPSRPVVATPSPG